LASEYVLPVFKNPKVVLNRSVSLTNRLEWRISGALRTDEPFYSPYSASSSLSFFWSEVQGVGLSVVYFTPGLSSTGKSLKENGVKDESQAKAEFYYDLSLAPHPEIGAFLNYQFSPFYGKASITKNLVLNFALYSFFGLGILSFRHESGGPLRVDSIASHFGIGQRIYLNKYFALDGGIDFLFYSGKSSVSSILKRPADVGSIQRPAYEKFKNDTFLRFLVRFGITVLI